MILRSELKYNEHTVTQNFKFKFNYLEINIPFDYTIKNCYMDLFKDRKDPHQWIEFRNEFGDYYVVAYYLMGAYVVRISLTDIDLQFVDLSFKKKFFSDKSWYPKFIGSHKAVLNSKNLFSISEVYQVIADVSKVNKLSIFK